MQVSAGNVTRPSPDQGVSGHSGSLLAGLAEAGRSPRAIVLENVSGCLTSHAGRDFAAIGSALSSSEYRFGAIVINASHFVPQSRPRVFFIAMDGTELIPPELVSNHPDPEWHPKSLVDAFVGLPPSAKKDWIWWTAAKGPSRELSIFSRSHRGRAEWRRLALTRGDGLSSQSHVDHQSGEGCFGQVVGEADMVGSVYRRTRPNANGVKRQRAEVRFDDLAVDYAPPQAVRPVSQFSSSTANAFGPAFSRHERPQG